MNGFVPGRLAYLLCLGGTLLFPYLVSAQPGTKDGLVLTVPNPITDAALQIIKEKIEAGFKRPLTTIVFDFNPNGQPSGTSNFGACYELANFIRSLQQGYKQHPKVGTVAFVHNETTQHTILPILACKQLVMSTARDEKTLTIKAQIGDIQRGLGQISDQDRQFYQKMAHDNNLGDLVERMLNKDFVLKRVTTKDGVFFMGLASIARWKDANRSFSVDDELPPGLEAHSTLFDAELARSVGLCQKLYDSRAELATGLRLSRRSLADDFDSTRVTWRIELKGTIDKGTLDSLERRLKTAVSRGANLIILQLESPGGDTKHVHSVANRIRELRDNNTGLPVKTVAWIPPGASLGAATFLALGCAEIVMAEDAVLGDFAYLQDEQEEIMEARRAMLAQLAKDQGYPPLLFAATLDRKLVLYRAAAVADPTDQRLLTEDEVDSDKKGAKRWRNLGRIDRPDGQFLKINAGLAAEWGVSGTDNIASVEALNARLAVDPSRVRVARDDWLDRIAEFFREPIVNFLLVMFGIIGLILELKMPGTSVPGVMAAICFVLFFWSYSFVGEFTLLAVLLFVLGIVLIGVEIFVIPGLGFAGISGLLLVVTSLALVTLEKWPSTATEWFSLGATLGTFGFSLAAALGTAFLVAWYLPSIPYANRLVLKPPEEDASEPAVPASLLEAIGIAATALRPAGKAQFGDDFLDVIAEGDYVNPGQRVQVIEIEGNRIVVKEV